MEVERIFNAEAENTWSTQVEAISGLITQKLEAMVYTNDPDSGLISSKGKVIWALLPHAKFLRQCQWGKILTLSTGGVRPPSGSMEQFATTFLDKPGSHLLSRAVLLASPHIPWYWWFLDNSRVSKWNAIALNVLKGTGEDTVSMDTVDERADSMDTVDERAVSMDMLCKGAVSDMEVSESVADMLLRIACNETLRPQIPAKTWVWLKKSRSLPVLSRGRREGTAVDVIYHIRGLGDIGILKSYFLLVWSEWDYIYEGGLREMEISIREDFGGVEQSHDRAELIERLDQVLGQLSLGPAHFEQHLPPWKFKRHNIQRGVGQYCILRNTLLEVDESVLLRMSLRLPS